MATPAASLICPTCYFVTSLPPAHCPLCGDTMMMEVAGEDPAGDALLELPWVEPWLASEEAVHGG